MSNAYFLRSPKPYLIRAFYDWIVDNNWTPYIAVNASIPGTQVPEEHVQDNKITLNIAPQAVKELHLNNDIIDFYARFSGVVKVIRVPIRAVLAIYASENGRGNVFSEEEEEAYSQSDPPASKLEPMNTGRPTLRIVKPEPKES
jgi:stringent starvation protein B